MEKVLTKGISQKNTVFVVEDNLLNRELLKEILSENYNVLEAENGYEGLTILKKEYENISLILLDVEMPVMNGYEFLKECRSDSTFSNIPIIVTTSKEESEEGVCLDLGATDFVRKPYNANILLKRVGALVNLKNSLSLVKIASIDPLTKLYNRNIFVYHCDELLKFDQSGNYSLLALGIDGFSSYNNYYGERVGNELLVHTANVIKEVADESMIYAKLSSSNYVIMFDQDKNNTDELIGRINSLINENEYGRFAKIKYAYYEDVSHEESISTVCNKLKYLLNEVTHQYHNNIVKYDKSMDEKAIRTKIIEENMEKSLKNKDFKVFYQPKINPFTDKIEGAEALVRWIHPTLGFISPSDFIPIFESNGFIYDLDYYVWSQVIDDIKAWKEAGLPLVPVSVNASRKDFIINKDISKFTNVVSEKGVSKDLLHVELTESACIDKDDVFPIVNKIREMGCKIEIDDFGSGYSSLGMIKELPMDILKLDITFSRSIEKQKEVVSLIIDLAHKLNVKTVAEGVETEEQLNILRELGCDYIQGYYYSKPLSRKDFEDYLKANS